MKAASVRELKIALQELDEKRLSELCLAMSRFKKENKELLTYLLFEADDEASYIRSIREDIELQFGEINTQSMYFVAKGVRKVLRLTKKYIRYSKLKATEVELLLAFCEQLNQNSQWMRQSAALRGVYERQIITIQKAIGSLHEDLQYDYRQMLAALD